MFLPTLLVLLAVIFCLGLLSSVLEVLPPGTKETQPRKIDREGLNGKLKRYDIVSL
jgi:hypothetical protein